MSTRKQTRFLTSRIDVPSFIIPGEDSAALDALIRQVYQDCRPHTLIERLLVDNIICDAWLLRRFARIDAEMLGAEILKSTTRDTTPANAGLGAPHNWLKQKPLPPEMGSFRKAASRAFSDLRQVPTLRGLKPVRVEHYSNKVKNRTVPPHKRLVIPNLQTETQSRGGPSIQCATIP